MKTKAIRRFFAAFAASAFLFGTVASAPMTVRAEEAAEETVTEEAVEMVAETEETEETAEESTEQEVQNILIIGQDRREGEGRARSDAMIVCSINRKTNQITMVSLMRDMYVEIPGHGSTRINAAYAYGGMPLLDETIEQNFGIHIDGNIEADFGGFIDVIDAIGGVEIDLNAEEAAYLNTDYFKLMEEGETWNLQEGKTVLTGAQTLAYARIRYIGNSDWERTERQRRVISSVVNKLKDTELTELLKLAGTVLSSFTTDMSTADLTALISSVVSSGMTLNSESYRLPVEGTYSSQRINGMAVLVPDMAANAQYLQEYLYSE